MAAPVPSASDVALGIDREEPRAELHALCRALMGYLGALEDSGAWGTPKTPIAMEPSKGAEAAGRSAAEAASSAPPASSTPDAGAERHLTIIEREARSCERCALHRGRKQTVFARGSGASGLAFVGEGPGEEEDRQGLPFVGPAGQLLDRMIAAMGLERDDVYVCNIVKCRPPQNRKPDLDEMASCLPYLNRQLEIIRPRVIVALGATAVQGLLGTNAGITRLRGSWKVYAGKIPVMPTFHPAYLLRQPEAKREVWADLKKVLAQLGTAP